MRERRSPSRAPCAVGVLIAYAWKPCPGGGGSADLRKAGRGRFVEETCRADFVPADGGDTVRVVP
ncbi:hypothetical protein GCM10009642_11790 [Nocardiopsis metallicus]